MRLDAVELSIVKLPLVGPSELSTGRVQQREFILAAVSCDAWRKVRGHAMAKAVLEMAIWDLAARAAGRPLCELIGGRRRPIPAGVSIGIEASIPALVDRVRIELAAGYQRVTIEIKPGWDREPVAAIRSALGGVPLMVDGNAAYGAGDMPALETLDGFDLMMIEQPLGYDDLVRHARLQATLRTAICLDESITGPDAAEDAIALQACRVITVKPGRIGGIGPSLAVHDAARRHGIPLRHGGMLESGIGRAHNLHLATLPGFTLAGDIAGRRSFSPELIDPPIDMQAGGVVAVPEGAGIGVDPVPSRLDTATIHLERFNA